MNKKDEIDAAEAVSDPARRRFLSTIGKAGLGAAAVAAAGPSLDRSLSTAGQNRMKGTRFYEQRANAAYQYRVSRALANREDPISPDRIANGDEQLYPEKFASYSKGLLHQPNGEVDPESYNSLLRALKGTSPEFFEQIIIGGEVKLTDPQSALAFDLEGGDPFSFGMPPAPAFASREQAAEIAENYWMAVCRDVPFGSYLSDPRTNAAAADLTRFGDDFKGAKNNAGQVTPDVLFRGVTAGDKIGPYISQFYYLPCWFGVNKLDQRIRTVLRIVDGGSDFMTDFDSWLHIQNGGVPTEVDITDPTPRYIRSGRDIGMWVHADMLFQAYFQAFLVMHGQGIAYDAGNPYRDSATQVGFGTFGWPHVASLLGEVASRALKVVWNQKWFVHRRIRPEAFAERVDRTAFHGGSYPVHQEILDSVTSAGRLGAYLSPGNAFLPMQFPEGCPTHPSYGAGHATVAGACSTILKAWFDETAIIRDPVVPDPAGVTLFPYSGPAQLTVGGELNKLASNVALARNAAGVHWRSDCTESLKLGEAVAISLLRDQKDSFNESFSGFSLTKFDGTTITI